MKLSGWGRFPVAECQVTRARRAEHVRKAQNNGGPIIPRGNGRAYGDSALQPDGTLDMRGCNRMLAFDEDTGVLEAEAGVMLGDVIETFLPRGRFPAVTPGTKYVTLGGMIAANVHGKNHHKEGGCAEFLEWVEVSDQSGNVRRLSRQSHGKDFGWTVGGMGLTGTILRCAIRLKRVESAWIKQRTLAARNLAEAIDIFEANADAAYSVAWIDCASKGASLGRSLVMLGEHARVEDLPTQERSHPLELGSKRKLRVPIDFPGWSLNRVTISLFNSLYYRLGKRGDGVRLVDWDSYFYPLDSILEWNRIYGRRGFAQYQCVLPLDRSASGMTKLLEVISQAGGGSFLAVLKRMGDFGNGISFPMEGYTLALDFPVNDRNLALLDELDKIVLEYGGRLYLAKDSRMSAATARKMDPRLEEFAQMRRDNGLTAHYSSLQSERLKL